MFDAGEDRFLCLPPGLQQPCVHFAALPERSGFAPFAVAAGPLEFTLVWSPGAFLHLRGEQKKSGQVRYQLELIVKKPAWLCIHPTLGSVLSGSLLHKLLQLLLPSCFVAFSARLLTANRFAAAASACCFCLGCFMWYRCCSSGF